MNSRIFIRTCWFYSHSAIYTACLTFSPISSFPLLAMALMGESINHQAIKWAVLKQVILDLSGESNTVGLRSQKG